MISFLKRIFSKASSSDSNESQLDYTIQDLKIGYILEYDFITWEVEEISIYHWDNGVQEKEYTIFDGKTQLFLNYSASDKKTSAYWKENLNDVWSLARNKIQDDVDMKTETFEYKGNQYHLIGEGCARMNTSNDSFTLINWLFGTTDEQHMVSFNKYEDGSIEVYAGKVLTKYAISKILPRA